MPEWAANRIGYQCFVDSFAIGNQSIHDKASLYPETVYGEKTRLLDWGEEFDRYSYGYSFYGGDLPGVSQNVSVYLSTLGIDLLYLTPIFKANTNHKYDTMDYRQIDPQFGSLEDFKSLVHNCHNHNIRLIIDGVFNHTSKEHPWFLKAQEGEQPFTKYYKKNKEGYYLFWSGIDTLPLLSHDSEDIRKELYESPESVISYWLEQGADGWRLDVAEELGHDVIRNIKSAMSERHPEKLLIGEVMETYGKSWLGNDLLDGVMNYVFLGTTVNFLTDKIDGINYMDELVKMYNEYPKPQLFTSWNLISSHDTNRMLYQVDGNENLFKMAVTLQFTYPGTPMIYYGDELGIIPGKKDESNRQGMDWSGADWVTLKAPEPWKHIQSMDWQRANHYNSIHFFYKHMIWLRRNNPALIDGEFIPLYSDEFTLAFLRRKDNNLVAVIVNKGASRNIKISVPDEIRQMAKVLKNEHGPLNQLDLTRDSVEIQLYKENTCIFSG